MSASALLSRLERVKQTGKDRWVARCPAHDDKGPSLSVRELPDGRTLAHCFAGCDIGDVIAAADLELDVLFPERPLAHYTKPERRPFPAHDVIACIGFEAAIVLDCGTQLGAGKTLSPQDHARLVLACGRIVAALDIANGE